MSREYGVGGMQYGRVLAAACLFLPTAFCLLLTQRSQVLA